LQASAKGIEVHGYKPRDVDLEKLAELQKELGPRADQSRNIKTPAAEGRTAATAARSAAREPLEREAVVDETRRSLRPSEQVIVEVLERSARKAGVPEATVTRLADYASRRYQNTRVVVGRLGEHGYAPYENDPKNESSYFLRVSTDKGDRTLWGVDLARAIKESGTKDGDEIVVVNRGRQPVAVQVKERDEAGKVVGTKTVSTHRNVWEVTELQAFRANVQEKFKQAAEKEAPPVNVLDRDAPRTVPRPEVVIQRTPDLERSR
jgi:putative DNA primase/helicase